MFNTLYTTPLEPVGNQCNLRTYIIFKENAGMGIILDFEDLLQYIKAFYVDLE